jgi:hypothetical protein
MSTSLKNKYADEILGAMAEQLGDESFTNLFHKEASLEKEAQGALAAFKAELAGAKDKKQVWDVWKKHESALQEADRKPGASGNVDEATQARQAKLGEFGPGETMPPAADDREVIATDFALKHLVKVADALDNQGFDTMANLVDETIEKISKKK